MKEPDFPFHSEKYYEGTRTMLPEERACYIDLMIYQHQNGFIPDDPKRILMYCSGITAEVLQATLRAKFVLRDEGWVNLRLEEILDEKRRFSEKQSINGSVGQFWKKAKSLLNKSELAKLRDLFADHSNEELYEQLPDMDVTESGLKAMIKALDIEANTVSWKTSYPLYLEQLEAAYEELVTDNEFISEQERLNPNVDVVLSFEKAKANFWATEAGWKNKKKARTQEINWKSTFINALGLSTNKVYKRHEITSTSYKRKSSRPDNSATQADIISRIEQQD